jgi:pyruvate dehydrogenase E1 component
MELTSGEPAATSLEQSAPVLREAADHILWLATSIVHHANALRPNSSGVKVGGHQASSASMVDIMTTLWFHELTREDRVSVKPHASPVLHAISYLLGDLDSSYLTSLRTKGGLQSYPSRTKDPDRVDYSTGSVGIGATAPLWGAVARRYLTGHRGDLPPGGRQWSLVGDAELDEGAVWEAAADPMVSRLGEVCWVVDLNRQSLDRVVPDIAAHRWHGMFQALGWQVLTVKYGRILEDLFGRTDGDALRERIDLMGNEEYQHLLRQTNPRAMLLDDVRLGAPLGRLLADLDDATVRAAVRDLGGHDHGKLLEAYAQMDPDVPSVLFAYTVKGRGLPTEGHPSNHSALLSADQVQSLAESLGRDLENPWARPTPDSALGALCLARAEALSRRELPQSRPPEVPDELDAAGSGSMSTQAAFGRFFLDLLRNAPEVAARVVTVSPDVASSTNLGGWINKVGVWSPVDRRDWFEDDRDRLITWREGTGGQHIELGIAETNLVGLLGELGATWSRWGAPLFPIGTVYDPFVGRALEPWSFGMYAGGQSILVGTPSGVSLAPEGGAHQSVTTPAIGVAQPGCTYWEPAFAQDLQWCLLHALRRLGSTDGESAYFRLSTLPLHQDLSQVPSDPAERAVRRRMVLAGGYPIGRGEGRPAVRLVGTGAVMGEVLTAAQDLRRFGYPVDVICVTSASRLFRAFRGKHGLDAERDWVLHALFPDDAPLVTVLDGHPSALAFLGSVRGSRVSPLGVAEFGQSGSVADLYAHVGIDAHSIVCAALDVVDP